MNRIILIGNGFDKAHNLKTGYDEFIGWYWDKWGERLLASSKNYEKDKLLSFKLLKKPNVEGWNQVAEYYFADFTISAHDFIEKVRKDSSLCKIEYKSELFSTICRSLKEAKWVDIENVFYELLRNGKVKPKKLNDDLDVIREKLIEYLLTIQGGIKKEIIKDDLRKKMFEPIEKEDVALSSVDHLRKLIELHLRYKMDEWETVRKYYSIDESEPDYLELKKFVESNISHAAFDKLAKTGLNVLNKTLGFLPTISIDNDKKEDEDIESSAEKTRAYYAPKLFFLPDRIMLLNFNYLTTADLYFSDKEDLFGINHIHGELSYPKSVIFGYGDELDENYKRLSEKNDNEYLRNIKSIQYLEAPNYRVLLEFIESDAYQIYIMGHSCGNSDRTLLNTLFEHKNCVSIKPFYHKWGDGTDNYMELVQNISRNFTDMRLMRDRVVNKTFCETI